MCGGRGCGWCLLPLPVDAERNLERVAGVSKTDFPLRVGFFATLLRNVSQRERKREREMRTDRERESESVRGWEERASERDAESERTSV